MARAGEVCKSDAYFVEDEEAWAVLKLTVLKIKNTWRHFRQCRQVPSHKLAARRMLAAAADLRQVFRILAVFAAILVLSRDRAATARMRALLRARFVCHLSTFFPEPT
jgi:hypothetical protein